MYLKAKETARLYQHLSEKRGNDTTDAMFKYIDNKTERAVEAKLKDIATKADMLQLREDLNKIVQETKFALIRWMFIMSVTQRAGVFIILKLLTDK